MDALNIVSAHGVCVSALAQGAMHKKKRMSGIQKQQKAHNNGNGNKVVYSFAMI